MNTKEIIEFLHEIEKLKKELRHSWLSDGRQESVAEHVWRTSMMVVLMADKLAVKVDIAKALKMAVVHDLAEVFVGDMPAQNANRGEHKIREIESMEEFKVKHNSKVTDEIYGLWQEYEGGETSEAKFVKALDKLEVRIQHNEADMKTWSDIEFSRSQYVADKHCEYDVFLKDFNEMVKKESKEKIMNESEKRIEDVLGEVDLAKK